jgi:hypothetical protein
MSVSAFEEGDKFVVTIKKNLLTNPENSWVNRYEAVAKISGNEGDLLSFMDTVVVFEQQLHSAAVFFSQESVATWEADSVPYDPTSFISIPLSSVGVRVVALELENLQTCLSVRRVCSNGRFGHLFYRGCLYEDEVSSPSGKSILTAPATVQTRIDTAIDVSEMAVYLGLTAPGAFQISMINKDGTQVRPVVGFTQGGVALVPNDHAWYNRTTP